MNKLAKLFIKKINKEFYHQTGNEIMYATCAAHVYSGTGSRFVTGLQSASKKCQTADVCSVLSSHFSK
jgi:hypothetical protein